MKTSQTTKPALMESQVQIETDPVTVQKLRAAISEGRLILRAGTAAGRTPGQLWAVRLSVEKALARIGESRLYR